MVSQFGGSLETGVFLPFFSPVGKDTKEVLSITERTSYHFSHCEAPVLHLYLVLLLSAKMFCW